MNLKETVLERFFSGLLAKKIEAEVVNEIANERKRLVSEISSLTEQGLVALTGLRTEAEKALAAVQSAEKALAEARAKYSKAFRAVMGKSMEIDGEIFGRMRRLEETADPAIGELQGRIREKMEVLRIEGIHVGVGPKNIFTEKREIYSDVKEQTAMAKKFRETIAELEQLKAQAPDPVVLEQKLRKIEEQIGC